MTPSYDVYVSQLRFARVCNNLLILKKEISVLKIIYCTRIFYKTNLTKLSLNCISDNRTSIANTNKWTDFTCAQVCHIQSFMVILSNVFIYLKTYQTLKRLIHKGYRYNTAVKLTLFFLINIDSLDIVSLHLK